MRATTIAPADAAGAGWNAVLEAKERLHSTNGVEIAAKVGAVIIGMERSWGGFVFKADGQPRIFDGVQRRVITVSNQSDAFQNWLGGRYGLLWNDKFSRLVANWMRAFIDLQGEKRATRRFSYYDREAHTLYLSRWNGTAYKLDGNTVTIVPNGEGVLFADDEQGDPIDADIGPHGELVPALVNDLNYATATDGGIDPEAQRDLFTTWMHAVGFADLFPTKPVLLVEGTKGSGKSLALKRLQQVLTGRSRAIILSQKGGEDDFGIQLLHSAPIALFDNCDTAVDWLKDAIAAYATSGSWIRRQKYTDAGLAEIKPSAFVGVSSRNAVTFRRDDIADRCIVIRLERRKTFTAEDQVVGELTRRRPRLYGEWLWNLNRCIAVMTAGVQLGVDQASRMADFGRFAGVVGAALQVPVERTQHALTAAQAERDALVLEDEPLPHLLMRWIDHHGEGEPVTAQKLLADLVPIMQSEGLDPYPSVKVLAARLRDKGDAMGTVISVERLKGKFGFVSYVIRRTDRSGHNSDDDSIA